jgi:hypothetical protein
MSQKIKILFLAANPSKATRFSVDQELRQIRKKLEQGSKTDSFELLINVPTRAKDLRRVLLSYKPHIVHFSGHGSGDQKIILEDTQGQGIATDTKNLVEAFRPLKNDVRVILLNACMTHSQATALGKVIDYTIGIEGLVGDKAAVTFAGAFYQALGFGMPVKDAFASAQAGLLQHGVPESRGFKFLVREGVDPTLRFPPVFEKVADQDLPLTVAVQKLVDGDADSDEISSVRKATLDGNLIIEQVEEGFEGEVLLVESLAAGGSDKRLRAQVDPITYRSVQERLFPPPPGIGPPLPSLIVVGRKKSLAEIRKLLSRTSTKTNGTGGNLVVVRGWPGVGKTTMVGILGRDPEVLSAFPDGVLWTSLDRAPELMSKIAEWGRALGTDEVIRTPTVDEAVAKLATILRHRRMLLIVDDIWNIEHALPFVQAAAGTQCMILATTRLPYVAEKLTSDPGRVYFLPVLTEADSVTLLRGLAGDVVEQYPEECRHLVNDLGNLPLALHVAGRLPRTEAKIGRNVSDLLETIRNDASILEDAAPRNRVDGTILPTLQVLLARSTDELDEFTRDCFAYLGPFAPKPATFDVAALKAVWQVTDPTPIIHKLVEHGLLEPVGGRFQMHELLVKHARSLLA